LGTMYPDARADQGDIAVVHVVKQGETLSDIAQMHQVSVEELREWNRLRGDRTLAGQRLRVWPYEKRWYRVKSGDTLSEIAARCGVSLPLLREINSLQNDRIYPGQRLRLIRVSDRTDEPVEVFEYVVRKGDSLSAIARRFDVGLGLLRQLNHIKSDQIHPGQRLQLRPSSLEDPVHTVRPGDTLSSIALKYQTTVAELTVLNDVERDSIHAGQELRLKDVPEHVYVVERGDALWEIAAAYGISVNELKRLNGLSSDRIYPGQELQLSVKRQVSTDTYVVKGGDYLGRIARLHQMSVSELKRLNNMRTSIIYPGDRLKVNPILRTKAERSATDDIDWDNLIDIACGLKRIPEGNGPYYGSTPKARQQVHADYFETGPLSPERSYSQARRLLRAFERHIDRLQRLSHRLKGWHVVLDPGHGGLDPGAVVENLDGNGDRVYVVEDEYVYDIALRVYVLLRLHGAAVTLTLLSPNHLIRHSDPPTRTFVNEKNEVYNSASCNRGNGPSKWPNGGRNGNLSCRVHIASEAFKGVPKDRRLFLSFHADIDPGSPEAPLVLYYRSRTGGYEDSHSKQFAQSLLADLGAGALARGQNLGVLRNNPALIKVVLEVRNLAYTGHAWAIRYEELRQRDAEKVVRGILESVRKKDRGR